MAERKPLQVAIGYSGKVLAFGMLAACVVGIGIDGLFGVWHALFVRGGSVPVKIIREPMDGKYAYIDPLLMVDVSMAGQPSQFSALHTTFQSMLNKQQQNGTIDSASISFREFNTGQWVSINPNDTYSPASLLKIPLMIAIFRVAETNPAILDRRIRYDGSFNLNDFEGVFTPSHPLQKGATYTVLELIQHMLAYSDNNATYLLSQQIDSDTENEVYTDLGLSLPTDPTNPSVDFMTVKQYASFFRVLYSSTYLTRQYSEQALSLLAQSDFTYGIRAGVATSTPIANKFGERTQYDSKGNIAEQELHDCGIVYTKDNPYLLCVMTKAKTFAGAAQFIRAVSKTAYDFVSAQK